MTSTPSSEEVPDVPLSALDRCDRCGAQAYVRTIQGNDLALLWCLHHWREHGDSVRETAKHVYDEEEATKP